MASLMTNSKWIKFFEEAGLPSGVAASYAVLFSDHRIQMDMLLDLSKEYLYDMGIHVMGDVIAILRHAKIAHAQQAKEKMMEEMQGLSTIDSKPTPTTRILDRYTRRTNNDASSATHLPSTTSGGVLTSSDILQGKDTVISLKRKQTVDVPDKKIRRILTEHEGPYKIKMPSGTTEKTRKILQQQGLQPVKKSVFDRLGDSVVSSSTDAVKTKCPSVFERLGPAKAQSNSEPAPASTVVTEEELEAPLQYQGVLKSSSTKQPTCPRTVNMSKYLKTSHSCISYERASILKRLGPKPPPSVITTESSPLSTIIVTNSLGNATVPTKRKLISSKTEGILGIRNEFSSQSIKTRLGLKVPISASSEILGEEPRKIRGTSLLCAAAGNIVARAKATAAARTAKRTNYSNLPIYERLGTVNATKIFK